MTEEEWLSCTDHAQRMVGQFHGTRVTRTKAGKRKLRLFACGCCRAAWAHMRDERLRRAVEVAERFAEGQATKEELAAARSDGEGLRYHGAISNATLRENVATDMAVETTHSQANATAFYMTATMSPLCGERGGERGLCDLVRCVFGNPYRPSALSALHRTPTVFSLARAAYDERHLPGGELDAQRLGVLADALEEIGAADEVVAHLREPGPHVRGCWVVDLCLGLN